ncbi:MAG: hypothetical protein AB1405_02060 [Bdellovibrionota bacterium]
MDNQKRAEWGERAVTNGTPDTPHNDALTNLTDALANMMHFAHAQELDFGKALEAARVHFGDEAESFPDELPSFRVKVEVSGGVAEVTECPPQVDVVIVDHDNCEATENENERCPECRAHFENKE